MNRTIITCVITAACLLAACGKSEATGPTSAKDTAAALTGDSKGSAATNPQCGLFTPAEAAKYIGEPVNAGQNAAAGTGCQWAAKDGSGEVLVQVVRASDHTPTTGADGYRALKDAGQEGFVVPSLGGWNAGAIEGSIAVEVSVDGAGASEATAIDLLKEAMKRKPH